MKSKLRYRTGIVEQPKSVLIFTNWVNQVLDRILKIWPPRPMLTIRLLLMCEGDTTLGRIAPSRFHNKYSSGQPVQQIVRI